MEINQVQDMYPEVPGFSDEIGRYVSSSGATYRAWWDGKAQVIDPDAESRRYGEEGKTEFFWLD